MEENPKGTSHNTASLTLKLTVPHYVIPLFSCFDPSTQVIKA